MAAMVNPYRGSHQRRQANDIELETWAAEIKLRAQQRIGEISKTLKKGKGVGADLVASFLPSSGNFPGLALLRRRLLLRLQRPPDRGVILSAGRGR